MFDQEELLKIIGKIEQLKLKTTFLKKEVEILNKKKKELISYLDKL